MDRLTRLEVRRMTPLMWMILRRAASGDAVVIGGSVTRSARILERRHFVYLETKEDGWLAITLAHKGQQALATQLPESQISCQKSG